MEKAKLGKTLSNMPKKIWILEISLLFWKKKLSWKRNWFQRRRNQSKYFSSHKRHLSCTACPRTKLASASSTTTSHLPLERIAVRYAVLVDVWMCGCRGPQSNYFGLCQNCKAPNRLPGVWGSSTLSCCLALRRLLSLDKHPLLLGESLPLSSPRAAVNEEPDYRFIFILAH